MRRHILAAVAIALAACGASAAIQPLADINRTVSLPGSPTEPIAFGSGWLLGACGAACYPAFTDGTPGGTQVLDDTLLNPGGFVSAGSVAFFTATTQASTYPSTYAIAMTDGTPAGTKLVPGATMPTASKLAVLGTSVLFPGSAGLWKTDGTVAGTVKLANLSNVAQLVAAGSTAFFVASDSVNGTELWKTDGTVAGTTLVADLMPGSDSSGITGLTAIGSKVFFWARGGYFAPTTLWVSDGTAAGTIELNASIAPAYASPIQSLGGMAYVLVHDTSSHAGLVRSDGTAAGTSIVQTWTGNTSYYYDSPRLGVGNGLLYFAASDATGTALWSSDGSIGGATRILAIPSASFVATTAGAFFITSTDSTGAKIYLTKGTPATTASFGDGSLSPVSALGARALLQSSSTGPAYVADGTVNGTVVLTTPAGTPNRGSLCARGSVVLGGKAVFAADDGVHGCELWVTDGTEAGTTLLKDIIPGAGGAWNPSGYYPPYSYPGIAFAVVGNFAVFGMNTPQGPQLWRTDGTTAGTVRIAASAALPGTDFVVASGGSVYFGTYGYPTSQLWRTDGTDGGTVMAYSASNEWLGGRPVDLNGALYFATMSYSYTPAGAKLVRLDGVTHAATTVATFNSIGGLQATTSQIFFGASSTTSSYYAANELWRSDGTAAGTRRIAANQFVGTGAYPYMSGLAGTVGDRVIFQVSTYGPNQLWASDGTDAGTVTLHVPTYYPYSPSFEGATAGPYFYYAFNDNTGARIYRTDGTPAGTWPIAADVTLIGATVNAVGGLAYFVGSTQGAGPELWMSAGNPAGTTKVEEYVPGLNGLTTYLNYGEHLDMAALPGGLVFFASRSSAVEPLIMTFDSTPNPIAFPTLSNATPSSFAVSAAQLVSGINTPTQAIATNGQFCVSSSLSCACDLAPYATTGTVLAGYAVCVKHPTPASANATTTTNLSVGGMLSTFTSITAPSRHLAVTVSGPGRVSSAPAGIDCGTTCATDLSQGTSITLDAVRAPNAVFTGWSGGGCSGIGSCTLTVSADVAVQANFTALARRKDPADFNGDGRADLLWRHPTQGVGVWLMDGMQARAAGGVAPPVAGAVPAYLADFDGDGETDILWRAPSGRYDITLMKGLVAAGSMTIYDGGTTWQVVGTADLDGDGKADLLWRHVAGSYGAWLMSGLAPKSNGALPMPDASAVLVLTADFDGDGKADVLWQRADGRVEMALMNGLAAKSTTQVLAAGTGWTPVAQQLDFNGDGKADLAWKGPDGSYGAWVLDGPTVTAAVTLIGANSGWTLTKAADLDGDGKSDLIWTHANGTVMAWLMDGNAAKASGSLMGAGTGWAVADAKDFNGDGRDDILWRHTSGQYAIWTMNGLAATAYRLILDGGSGWETAP